MQLGQATVDFEALRISGPAGDHAIEPKVMQVLSVLVDNADEVVTRETLIDEVWGVGYGGDERLSRAISLLRKALGDKRGAHNIIQTIPKTGYKFVSPEISESRDGAAAFQNSAPEVIIPETSGYSRIRNLVIVQPMD